MSIIAKVLLPPLWRSRMKKAKGPSDVNGVKAPATYSTKAGASQPPGVPPVAIGSSKEDPKPSDALPKMKPWVKPGSQAPAPATSPPASQESAAPVAVASAPAPASAPEASAAAPPATDTGLRDDLKSLFTEDDVGNEALHKLAAGLKELDVNELAQDCRGLVALLKGRVAQN